MKIEDLFEAPQEIFDLPEDHLLNVQKTNAIETSKLLADNRLKLIKQLSDNINLYEVGPKYVVIDERTLPKRCIYYVKYSLKNINYVVNRQAVSQILVWKKVGASSVLSGLPSKIFFDYLLPKTGLIITDYQQTSNGRRFWGDRIAGALERGLYVYYVNLQPERVLGQITNVDQLDNLSSFLYGKHQKYRQRRIFITNTPLEVEQEEI